jgi:putative tricarboxylic transport membrane protein
MRDWVLAIAAVIGGLVYLYADSKLPLVRIGDPLGPRIFPAIIGTGIVLSGLLLMVEIRKRRAAAAQAVEAAVVPHPRKHERPGVLIGMLVWTALYYLAFEPVGYLVSTVIFLLGLLAVFNRGRHLTNLAVALGFTAVAYTIFDRFLAVPMPEGILPF